MKIFSQALVGIILVQTHLVGQIISAEREEPFSYNVSYIGDVTSNFSGGMKKGTLYLGMANIKIGLETEPLGWWSGGQLSINLANTHGAMPSRDFIGDYQKVSSIEAGDHAYIQELWFKQTLSELQFIVGVQDVNVEFARNSSGSLFLNGSFGILPTISGNIPSSVFPLTSLGFTVVWFSSDHMTWRAALYDGLPTAFEHNPYNIKWDLRQSEGIINLLEAEYFLGKETMYKIGIYHHDHLFTSEQERQELVYEHNVGVYGVTDVRIYTKEDHTSVVHLFAQAGFSSRVINENYWYGGLGVRVAGVFADPVKDEAGFAVAHAGMRSLNDETTIELTYWRHFSDHLYLQPDIQFIFHPAGAPMRLQNSFVGTVRFRLQF
jgi:porin